MALLNNIVESLDRNAIFNALLKIVIINLIISKMFLVRQLSLIPRGTLVVHVKYFRDGDESNASDIPPSCVPESRKTFSSEKRTSFRFFLYFFICKVQYEVYY